MDNDSAPDAHSWSELVWAESRTGTTIFLSWNIVILARLAAHTNWSAVFNWRRIVVHTPVLLYIPTLLLHGYTVPTYLLFLEYVSKKSWRKSLHFQILRGHVATTCGRTCGRWASPSSSWPLDASPIPNGTRSLSNSPRSGVVDPYRTISGRIRSSPLSVFVVSILNPDLAITKGFYI